MHRVEFDLSPNTLWTLDMPTLQLNVHKTINLCYLLYEMFPHLTHDLKKLFIDYIFV